MNSQLALGVPHLLSYAKVLYPNDFAIIAGNHKYRCSKILAAFLSPRISQLISTDIMIDRFVLHVDDSKFRFKEVLNLANGKSIPITAANFDYLLQIAEILDNQEMFAQLQQHRPSAIDSVTVIRDALAKLSEGSVPTAEFQHISSNLSDFGPSDFRQFDIDNLSEIFFSNDVRVTDESSLFSLVLSIIHDRGPSARHLLYSIEYENLPLCEMIQFSEEVKLFEVTGPIFYSLCKRLAYSPVTRQFPMRRISDQQEFPFAEGRPFDGLFAHIQDQWKRNAHEEGIVRVTTSDGTSPARVTDHNWRDSWYSRNTPNSWIQFDFVDHAFQLQKYSIRTFVGGPNSGHLKNWVMEGSNTGKEWTEIDRRQDNSDLNNRNKQTTFSCREQIGIFRYIRLRQIGSNHSGNNFLFLGNVEFFGCIY
jgi:hypothetical protein